MHHDRPRRRHRAVGLLIGLKNASTTADVKWVYRLVSSPAGWWKPDGWWKAAATARPRALRRALSATEAAAVQCRRERRPPPGCPPWPPARAPARPSLCHAASLPCARFAVGSWVGASQWVRMHASRGTAHTEPAVQWAVLLSRCWGWRCLSRGISSASVCSALRCRCCSSTTTQHARAQEQLPRGKREEARLASFREPRAQRRDSFFVLEARLLESRRLLPRALRSHLLCVSMV